MAKLRTPDKGVKTEFISNRRQDYSSDKAFQERFARESRSSTPKSAQAQGQIDLATQQAEQKARTGAEISQAEYTLLQQGGRIDPQRVDNQEVLRAKEYERVSSQPIQTSQGGIFIQGREPASYRQLTSPYGSQTSKPVSTQVQKPLTGWKSKSFMGMPLYRQTPIATETQQQIAANKNYPILYRAVNYPFGQLNIAGKEIVKGSEKETTTPIGRGINRINQAMNPFYTPQKVIAKELLKDAGTLVEFAAFARLFSTGTTGTSEYSYDYSGKKFIKKKQGQITMQEEKPQMNTGDVREIIRTSTQQQNLDRLRKIADAVRQDPSKQAQAKQVLKLFEEELGKEKAGALMEEFLHQEGIYTPSKVTQAPKEVIVKQTTKKPLASFKTSELIVTTPRMEYAGEVAGATSVFTKQRTKTRTETKQEQDMSQDLVIKSDTRQSKAIAPAIINVAATGVGFKPRRGTGTTQTPTTTTTTTTITTPAVIIGSSLFNPPNPPRVPRRPESGGGFALVPFSNNVEPTNRYYTPSRPSRPIKMFKAPTGTLLGVMTGQTQSAKSLRGKFTGFETRGIPIYGQRKGTKLIKKKTLSPNKLKGGKRILRL